MSLLNIFKKNKVIIFDDNFPYLLSGFRIAEYNYYLKNFKNIEIYSSSENFDKHMSEYKKKYPKFTKKIKKFESRKKYTCSIFYTIFLNNIYEFLPIIENSKTPFVFTLYPGGGFWIDQKESDDKLKKVCSSKYFKKVIVTQKNTYNYLLNKKFCSPKKIEHIYGGVVPSDFYKKKHSSKEYYKKNKNTLDICFVANKYMEKGLDKGYDVFIETAKILTAKTKDIYFHVIGGYEKNEIDTQSLGNRIKFYGLVYKEFFPNFYSKMDIILSPNRPYVLLPGAFDGFPTASCAEAGLAGVALFCSDKLKLNPKFINKKDICIIPINAQKISNLVLYYYRNIDKLYKLAKNCQKSLSKSFDIKSQMEKRFKLLNKFYEN